MKTAEEKSGALNFLGTWDALKKSSLIGEKIFKP